MKVEAKPIAKKMIAKTKNRFFKFIDTQLFSAELA